MVVNFVIVLQVPVPMQYIPPLRHVPLRVEYIVRVNTARPSFTIKQGAADKEPKVRLIPLLCASFYLTTVIVIHG